MKSHPLGWLFIWHIKERLELIAVVNEAPVALQSRDLSEAVAEGSTLPTSTKRKLTHSGGFSFASVGRLNWAGSE